MAEAAGSLPVVLVVEDEAPNRALLQAVVARAADRRVREATIVEAANLLAARKALAERRVDLVLLDVRLPDGSGLTLARELAERPAARRPRVVVLSASVLPAERETALRAGADAFLGKPYRPADLVGLILEMIEAGPHRGPAKDDRAGEQAGA